MTRRAAQIMFTILALSISQIAIAQPDSPPTSAADFGFTPPVLGGTTEIAEPAKVAIDDNIIKAASIQDAANAAAKKTRQEYSQVGAVEIHFPSGIGIVATGAGHYRTMQNPTATSMARRQAYVIAYTEAKKNLVETLDGSSVEAKTELRQQYESISTPVRDMTNLATDTDEAIKQVIEGMIRGFAVYEVVDDVDTHTVYVTLVSTPRTAAGVSRPGPDVMVTADAIAGLNQVIAEVRAGVIPPVGTRIIMNPKTNETIVIGFGSAVIGRDDNQAIQAKKNIVAQKIAALRSKDALISLLGSDRIEHKTAFDESMSDQVKQFEKLQEGDPIAKATGASARQLAKVQQVFEARNRLDEETTSVRRGVLPPGVATRTWFDGKHEWAYSMSVYSPALSERIRQQSSLVEKAAPDRRGDTQEEGGFTDEQTPVVPTPPKIPASGPTGQVTPDEDL